MFLLCFFLFHLSVCFSGAKSSKGTDKKQCGNSTSSSKSRYERRTGMAVTSFEAVMIFLSGRNEGGNFLCVQRINGNSGSHGKLKHVLKLHSVFSLCYQDI